MRHWRFSFPGFRAQSSHTSVQVSQPGRELEFFPVGEDVAEQELKRFSEVAIHVLGSLVRVGYKRSVPKFLLVCTANVLDSCGGARPKLGFSYGLEESKSRASEIGLAAEHHQLNKKKKKMLVKKDGK